MRYRLRQYRVHPWTYGGREKTRTHEDGTFWPQDLLPNDFPKTRILTFGYNADIAHVFGQASTNTLLIMEEQLVV